MRRAILAAVVVMALAPMSANAVMIEFGGHQWNVTVTDAPWSFLTPTPPAAMPWWGSAGGATSWAEALRDQAGLINVLFAYEVLSNPNQVVGRYCSTLTSCTAPFTFGFGTVPGNVPGSLLGYAQATRVAVPEPAGLALLGIGLAAMAWARRRNGKHGTD